MDWPQRYGAALDLTISEDEVDAVLDLARDVAHATERRFAPLSAYLTGRYVGLRVAEGADLDAAVREATEIADRLLADQ